MVVKGVIFDFDGTLADTLPDLTDAVNVGLAKFGYPPRSDREIRRWVGDGMPSLCARAIAGCDEPTDENPSREVLQLAEVVSDYYRRHRLDKTVPYQGIPAMLDALVERGLLLAVLSNKPHEHMGPMIEALFGRWPWLAVEGSGPGRPRKPDPTVAQSIIRRMGCSPSQVMFVGDSAADVATGRNAGMVTGPPDRPS